LKNLRYWIKWQGIYLVLRELIIKRTKDNISGQSMGPDKRLCRHFDDKRRRPSLSGIRFKKFKSSSYDSWGGGKGRDL